MKIFLHGGGGKIVVPDGTKFEYTTATDMSFISNIDTSQMTDMYNMFYNVMNVENLDLSGFDTSNVTTMQGMFDNFAQTTSAFQTINLSSFDTRNVIDMNAMFRGCSNLTYIPILNTSKIGTSQSTGPNKMNGMFTYCSSLSNESLNNIMKMCIDAVNVRRNKTLKNIGLTQAQTEICATLSNYQDLLDAGWTTGY